MCYKWEFNRNGEAKNRLTCARLTLNIIGLFTIICLGVLAALFATYSTEWFPVLKGNDNVYNALQANHNGISKLDNATAQTCTNKEDAKKMVDRFIFKCQSGMCLPADQRCDGYVDCEGEMSDERECDRFCKDASSVRFSCKVKVINGTIGRRCFHTDYRCDGELDCTGESEYDDENQCEDTIHIQSTGIKCSKDNSLVCGDHRVCVRPERKCDGFENCYDGSDEKNC